MPGTGNSRAEAQIVATASGDDLVKIQQLQSAYPAAGQYWEKEITVSDLSASGLSVISVSVPSIAGLNLGVALFSSLYNGVVTGLSVAVESGIITSDIIVTPYITTAGVTNSVAGGVVTLPFSGSTTGTTATAIPTLGDPSTFFVPGSYISATVTGGVGTDISGVISLYVRRT